MIRSNLDVLRRPRTRVAVGLGIVLLAGCGSATADDNTSAEPEVRAGATDAVALDLTGVSIDVRRDPG